MYGQKLRKRLEKEAKEKDRAKRCACGNYCGDDGLCNACRTAKATASSATFRPRERVKPSGQGEPKTKAESAKQAVLISCPDDVEADIVEYLADAAATLLEDETVSADEFRQELTDSFLPILDQYQVPPKVAAGLCELIHRAAFPTLIASHEPTATILGDSHNASDVDLLCRIPNLILMYGGSPEPLLKDTVLELARGHCYGIVGSNGSGKSTLMSRIAMKDITGFPDMLRVVHLRQEAILEGVSPTTTAREYAQLRSGGRTSAQALRDVGFENEGLLDKTVVKLSGGWQMRLALACAMAQKANILLLDEPTNHLDIDGVRWLEHFVNRVCVGGEEGTTALIVSHDPAFLNQVCTDVIHFTQKGKLAYHPGNFEAFKMHELGGDDLEANRLLETASSRRNCVPSDGEDRMAFPVPEKLGETVAARKAPVITLQCSCFRYSNATEPVLRDVDIQVSQSSRVGIIGKNGSGKSTLLRLIAGRMQPNATSGAASIQLWRNKHLRLAYIAQDALVHLGNYLGNTPLEYMQARFRRGFDQESPIKAHAIPSSKDDAEKLRMLGVRHGKRGKQVESLLSRIDADDELEALYEVKWMDLSTAENTFESRARLKELGVSQLMAEFDENLWIAWAGADQRPLTTVEVVQHLQPFGLPEDVICNRKISMLSSGQKSKLTFAAAFWTRPHILCLDEPTNYIDVETVTLLQRAIRSFRGGCAVVSHNETFVAETCNEIWEVEDGHITVRKVS